MRRVHAQIAFGLAAALAMTAPGAAAQTIKPPLSAEQRRAEHMERERRIAERIAAAGARWRQSGAAVPVLAAATPPATPPRGRAAPSPLAAFHRALAASKRPGARARVTVLQLGDSHTAAEAMPGYLRERLQRQFGDGGRGTLAAGVPFRYYTPYQVNVGQSAGWSSANARNGAGAYGLSSHVLTASKGGEAMELLAIGERSFDRIEIEYLRAGRGGAFEVLADGKIVATVPTRGAGGALARWTRDLPAPARHLAVRVKGTGPVSLLSWSALRRSGGVVVVNHGVTGETINLVGRWTPSVLRQQMAQIAPALVLLAFGTNEGFNTAFNAESYRVEFRQRLAQLRAAAPRASFVVIGPPDAARLPSWCPQGLDPAWKPLSAEQARGYAALIAAQSPELCRWHAPPALAEVRRIQAEEARRAGVLFWDWSKVMGGPGGTDKWARAEPALAHADRVHLTVAGYDISAEALFRDLLSGYKP